VLRTLASQRRMHGYAITSHIQRVSTDLLRVEEGSLYPALHRLESHGFVQSEWRASENNRRARFYTLTPAGRRRLKDATNDWNRIVEIMASALRHKPGEV
jgi:transcriptional regulator